MNHDKAIVTLTIGRRHAELWQRRCRRNWSRYAARHGYDLVCLDRPLDDSPRALRRSPSWQKCLVLGHPLVQHYERVVWMDADVLINPSAPSIVDDVPEDRVGAVDEYATPTRELYAQTLRKLYRHWEAAGIPFIRNETARAYHEVAGLRPGFDRAVQGGVLVLSPHHHRQLLETVYHSYEDRGTGWNYEMRPLSFELQRAGAVEWLDPRFNYVWEYYKALHFPFLLNHPDHPRARASVTAALHDVHCLHFAGSSDEMDLADDEPPRRPRARRRAAGHALSTVRSPVALLIFARPDLTRQVLTAVRAVRPRQLLVVADAPTPGDAAEGERCAAARAVIDEVDWDCDLRTNYAGDHLGLKRRVETGLDWVFETVEEAIVLEDDCVAHPSFFRFCDDLLAHHRDDPRVMSISGNSFESRTDRSGDGYRYSRYPLIWGWATWRRAWRHYDPAMSRWPELRTSGWLEELLEDRQAVAYWKYVLDGVYRDRHTWDFAWTLASWLAGGLCAVPDVNLVTNVGFRTDGTHTRHDHRSPFANLPTEAASFPLRHPPAVTRDVESDRFIEDVLFSGNVRRLFERLRAARRATPAGAHA